jgi:hypothetical protein
MGNVIGQPLDGYVIDQINARQTLHGSGVRFNENERNPDQINILNSNTAWIKLASGVSIDPDGPGMQKLKDLGFTESERSNLSGVGLAKKYVLHAGISQYNNGTLSQREGFNPPSFGNDSIARDTEDSSYIYSRNLNSQGLHTADAGYAPMPGIISAEIKALNRGSLEKAFIKIKAQNRQQLDILDILYMRLGYTVLLEWGNSLYTDDGVNKKIVRNTIIEDRFFKFSGKRSYLDFLGGTSNPLIKSYKRKYSGNYDGMLAVISNFSWTFNPDGSYDIDLTLISLGDVIESLKTNVSIDKGLSNYINTTIPSLPGSEEDPVEKNKDSSLIHSMLWLFKRFGPNSRKITTVNTYDTTPVTVGYFLNSGPSTLTTITKTYKFRKRNSYDASTGQYVFTEFNETYSSIDPDSLADQRLRDIYRTDHGVDGTVEGSGNRHLIEDGVGEFISWVAVLPTSTTAVNPIADARFNTAFQLETNTKHYYLKFLYLLEFLQSKVIPLIKDDNDNTPLFNIDISQWENKMYSLPNQISLDPRVCLVRNDHFLKWDGNISTVMKEIELFRAIDDKVHNGTANYNLAYPLNIYLNFEFIINSLESNTNDRGDVNIHGFISTICTGLNKALGGINNLEPVIDKDTNYLTIIDSTPIPGVSCPEDSSYELMLYGYKGSNFQDTQYSTYESNFIRNIDLKTTITPEYATMVTVGATADGYVKGTEATAFSIWNKGLTDRFKNELIPSNPPSQPVAGTDDEAKVNYVEEFIKKTSQCYGFSSLRDDFLAGDLGDLNDDIIGKNLSVVTEFYKYLFSKQPKTKPQAGGIGFIPFKLGITMDGISGIKIYNKLNVDSSFLPTRYGETLNFIITGVNHRLQNNDWETTLETIVMPKTSKIDALDINITAVSPTTTTTSTGCPTINFVTNDTRQRTNITAAIAIAQSVFPTLSKRAIAALLGHLQAESQLNPTAYNSGGGGCGAVGLAQWRGARQQGLFNYAASRGTIVNDFKTQLEYVKQELSTGGNYFNKVWNILNQPNLSLIQYGATVHLTYGLGPGNNPNSKRTNSNPNAYEYKKIGTVPIWQYVYVELNGPRPLYIPTRYGYMQNILSQIP